MPFNRACAFGPHSPWKSNPVDQRFFNHHAVWIVWDRFKKLKINSEFRGRVSNDLRCEKTFFGFWSIQVEMIRGSLLIRKRVSIKHCTPSRSCLRSPGSLTSFINPSSFHKKRSVKLLFHQKHNVLCVCLIIQDARNYKMHNGAMCMHKIVCFVATV